MENSSHQSKYHFIILTALWLLIHTYLFLHFGIRNLLDAKGYVKGADFLLANGALEDIHHLFYVVPIGFIAFFRWIFPDQIIPFLIFQCLLSGLALLTLYRSASKVFNSTLAGFLSGVIFLLWWDNIHWNTTTMTESIACSVTCFMLYRLIHFKATVKDYLWIAGLIVVTFFVRPTGVIVIVGCVGFLLAYHRKVINSKPVLKFFMITGLLLVAYFGADLMFTHWDFTEEYPRGNIVTYMDTIEGSELYNPDLRMEFPETAVIDAAKPPVIRILHFIAHNPLYFIKTSALKIWYLATGIRPYYSLSHNLYCTIWMTFIYLMFYWGLTRLTNSPVKIFTLTVIVVNCGLIAISTVDWDNRFYIPMEPGIVLIAGGGAAYLVKRLQRRVIIRNTT